MKDMKWNYFKIWWNKTNKKGYFSSSICSSSHNKQIIVWHWIILGHIISKISWKFERLLYGHTKTPGYVFFIIWQKDSPVVRGWSREICSQVFHQPWIIFMVQAKAIGRGVICCGEAWPNLTGLLWSFVHVSCRLSASIPHRTRINLLYLWVLVSQTRETLCGPSRNLTQRVSVPAGHCACWLLGWESLLWLFCVAKPCVWPKSHQLQSVYRCLTIPGHSGGRCTRAWMWHRRESRAHWQPLLCPRENFLQFLVHEAKTLEKCSDTDCTE